MRDVDSRLTNLGAEIATFKNTAAQEQAAEAERLRQMTVAELAKIGVTDVRFELFDATHMGIDYRYPLSLAYLAEKLSP